MNTFDYIVVAIVLGLFAVAIISIIKQRKKGGCCTSCADCKKCKSCTLKKEENDNEKDKS